MAKTIFSRVIFLVIFAGLVGILFGILVTRGLTRRLNNLTRMTSGWGKGNFSIINLDDAGDEISQLSNDLNRTASELQQLMQTRQNVAVLEERNRLARDLHDNVKQQVFALTMNLGAVRSLWKNEPDTAFQKVEAANELAQQMQVDLSGLINALRPVQLENKSLIEALREYTLAWEKRSSTAAIFQVEGVEIRLPEETEKAVYLVAQEALSNVSRHSNASAASLTVQFQPSRLRIIISDNGRGFDLGAVHSGLGLMSMKERMRGVGGDLELRTAPSEGTRIIVEIPIINKEGQI